MNQFTEKQKEDAKKILKEDCDKYFNGKSKMSQSIAEKHLELRYIITGKKSEHSPKEPQESNRSFFHLKDFPTTLKMQGIKESFDGLFTHPDYCSYYEFKYKNGLMYFSGGEEFDGIIDYEDYEPKRLFLSARIPASKEMILANNSLSSSQL